jgi:hypothetical protein
MSKVWILPLAVMLSALAWGAAAADGAGSPAPCQYGAPLSQGTTTISFNGGTATAVVSGWSFCGEATLVAYDWSTGATSQSISVSPGQCVSVTTHIGTNSNGLAWTQTASGCAPSASGGGTCDSPSITGRDSDGDGTDDACDPTPFPYDITTGSISMTSESEVAGPQRVLQGATSRYCNANARLKTREYRVAWTEAFLTSVTFLAFTVHYQVCYVPGYAIQWGLVFNPESPYALVPWAWLTTNESGFPSVRVTNSSATFQWQGSAAICAWHFACGPTRHPGVTITFRPDNTESRSQYVG